MSLIAVLYVISAIVCLVALLATGNLAFFTAELCCLILAKLNTKENTE